MATTSGNPDDLFNPRLTLTCGQKDAKVTVVLGCSRAERTPYLLGLSRLECEIVPASLDHVLSRVAGAVATNTS
jgi:hypothetical protein